MSHITLTYRDIERKYSGIAFVCWDCWNQFRKNYSDVEIIYKREFDGSSDCGPVCWENGSCNTDYYVQRRYYTTHCPECGHLCERTDEDYDRQLERDRKLIEAEKKVLRKLINDDLRVEWFLERTKRRRAFKEFNDRMIMRIYDEFSFVAKQVRDHLPKSMRYHSDQWMVQCAKDHYGYRGIAKFGSVCAEPFGLSG